jgi:hypothetical protein
MAIYMSRVKTFPREKGARVTRAAAYRAGERIRDERSGKVYSYLGRRDVFYKEVIVPSEFAGNAEIAWTQDRSSLWNAVERTERCNAQLGREVMVVLPAELSGAQRTQLVRGYAQDLADRYRCAVDTTIHLPRPDADERNHHAHLLMTPREVTPKGLGPRTSFGLSGTERSALGLCRRSEDLLWQRERWAKVANDALAAAGLNERVDHRAPRKTDRDREPPFRLPLNIHKMELVSGKPSRVGEALRRQYRERVEARLKGPAELARVVQRQKDENRRAVLRREALEAALPKKISRAVLNRDELNQERREQYHADKARSREIEASLSPEQQSVQRWLQWRERQQALGKAQAPTAEDSVRRWLAYREAQKNAGPSQVAVRDLFQDEDDLRRRRKTLDRTRDYGLEL